MPPAAARLHRVVLVNCSPSYVIWQYAPLTPRHAYARCIYNAGQCNCPTASAMTITPASADGLPPEGTACLPFTPAPVSQYPRIARVHLVDAPMTSYVYDEKTGLVTAILDNENIGTRYEYDAAGRLIKTEREFADKKEIDGGFKVMNEYVYNFGVQ